MNPTLYGTGAKPTARRETEHIRAIAHDLLTDMLLLVTSNLQQLSPPQVRTTLEMVRQINTVRQQHTIPSASVWRSVSTLLGYQLREQIAFVKRRLQGDYYTDPYGMDREIVEAFRPFMRFMYRTWWRVSVMGLEHVPGSGRALLVANHSGVLPWDSAMIATAILEEHASPRLVRNLYLDWFKKVPFVASVFTSLGQVHGLPENAISLLEDDELVCTFPEGLKGIAKIFAHRYKLARFGRGGFVQTALRTGAPIVPVAVVGAEETYPMFTNVDTVARLLRLPFFPLTPLFPWLGPLGMIPLPTRWSITFCPPISTIEYGTAAADDPLVVTLLSERVRTTVQETINRKLLERTSIF